MTSPPGVSVQVFGLPVQKLQVLDTFLKSEPKAELPILQAGPENASQVKVTAYESNTIFRYTTAFERHSHSCLCYFCSTLEEDLEGGDCTGGRCVNQLLKEVPSENCIITEHEYAKSMIRL
ncbi:unnamed protein product [Eretmochelys imbricata]